MKKRTVCLFLVVCIMASFLSITALADGAKPEAKFDFILSGKTVNEGAEAALVMKAGDAAAYYATKQTDPNFPDNWYLTPGTESEWNVKFEYSADGVATITLKDAKIYNSYGIWFGSLDEKMSGNVNVVLEGTNKFQYLSDDSWEQPKNGLLMLCTTGTSTIKGSGKLECVSDNDPEELAVITSCGDIVLDNVDLLMNMPETYGTTSCIRTTGGDITMKGGKFTLIAYDDPETVNAPGQNAGGRLFLETVFSAFYAAKRADETGGNLTVKDNANVLMFASPYTSHTLMYADNLFTIDNSTVEVGMVCNAGEGAYIFKDLPNFVYENDTYTVIATKGKNPEYTYGESTMTPAMDRRLDLFNWPTGKMSQLTYFKVVAGGPGGPYCDFPEEENTDDEYVDDEYYDDEFDDIYGDEYDDDLYGDDVDTGNSDVIGGQTPEATENNSAQDNKPDSDKGNVSAGDSADQTPGASQNNSAQGDNSDSNKGNGSVDNDASLATDGSQDEDVSQATDPVDDQDDSDAHNKKSSGKAWIWIVVLGILALAGGGFALYCFVLKPKMENK